MRNTPAQKAAGSRNQATLPHPPHTGSSTSSGCLAPHASPRNCLPSYARPAQTACRRLQTQPKLNFLDGVSDTDSLLGYLNVLAVLHPELSVEQILALAGAQVGAGQMLVGTGGSSRLGA
jgi:hypothetical protein